MENSHATAIVDNRFATKPIMQRGGSHSCMMFALENFRFTLIRAAPGEEPNR